MQLFSVVFALLLHIFFKKCLQRINPIQNRLYKSSSSKIMLLCFMVDLALIESMLHKYITAITKCLKNEVESYNPNIPWLNNTSKKSISSSIKTIITFLLKILILFCILGFYFCLISISFIAILIFLLYISIAFYIAIRGVIETSSLIYYFSDDLVQEIMKADSVILAIAIGFGGIVFIGTILAPLALLSMLLPVLVLSPFTSASYPKLKLKPVGKSLYRHSKTLFLFLIVFVPYYIIISTALFLLVFVLPFVTVKTFHSLIGFLFFSFTIIGLFFFCRRSKI